MPRTYLRIGYANKLRRRECAFCQQQGLWEVRVQTNEMRGDDEVFYLCQEHEHYRSNPVALVATGKGKR